MFDKGAQRLFLFQRERDDGTIEDKNSLRG